MRTYSYQDPQKNYVYVAVLINIFFQSAPDPNAGLAEAIQVDTQNRARLQEMYDEILKYYDNLPSQHQTSLNSAYPDLVNTIAAKRKQLDSRELVILVAGMRTYRNDYTMC